MKFLVDMNLSPRWVELLLLAGHEATHWSDIGEVTATDAHIMAVAADEGAVVLTNDLDFGTILAARGHSGPSVIQLRAADLRPESLGDLLLAAITQVAEELRDGALVTVDPGRTRVRVLPLTPR
jgi:predicted nuclease of predicted toxin-antitoxin system